MVPSLVLQVMELVNRKTTQLLTSHLPQHLTDKSVSNLTALALQAEDDNSLNPANNNSNVYIACPVCGKFIYGRNRRQGLERHMRTHTKEKPYQCPMCPHRASMQHNMRNHILIMHTSRHNSSTDQQQSSDPLQHHLFDSINSN